MFHAGCESEYVPHVRKLTASKPSFREVIITRAALELSPNLDRESIQMAASVADSLTIRSAHITRRATHCTQIFVTGISLRRPQITINLFTTLSATRSAITVAMPVSSSTMRSRFICVPPAGAIGKYVDIAQINHKLHTMSVLRV